MPGFTCPKCGGSTFGTTFPGTVWGITVKVKTGHCHTAGCDFTWERTDENDQKLGIVFKPPAHDVGAKR